MKPIAPFVLVVLLVPALAACKARPAIPPTEVLVSAAASLTDVLREAQRQFEAENKPVKIRFNFGSSGALQQQIEKGAPVDLFIAASTAPVDALVRKGSVSATAVRVIASNEVVLIQSASTPALVRSWDDLRQSQVTKIAIGNPEHVPAGMYGREVLERLGLWPAVERKLVFGEDVRQVLHFVESGEVQAGIVYGTDAASSKKVTVVAPAPAASHAPVVYPAAIPIDARNAAGAKAFTDFLISPKGKAILGKFGFGTVD